MFNEYARKIALDNAVQFSRTKPLPPFTWVHGQIPNDLGGKDSVRIRDTAPIFRLQQDQLVAEMTTWAWLTPRGKPVLTTLFGARQAQFTSTRGNIVIAVKPLDLPNWSMLASFTARAFVALQADRARVMCQPRREIIVS